MKQYFNKFTLYALLWFLYYLQGTLYASGSIISQGLLAIILLWSLYIFFKVNLNYNIKGFLLGLNCFLVVLTIYGMLNILDPMQVYYNNIYTVPMTKINYLKILYMSLLPIFVVYYYTQKNKINEQIIRAFSILWLIVSVFSYIRYNNEAVALLSTQSNYDDIEVTNNVAYDFLLLLPLMFFWNKKPIIQFALLIIIFGFILSGMKRGAIIIGVGCLLWFLYRIIKNSTKRSKILILILSCFIVLFGVKFAINMYETSPYFQYRFEQTLAGNSSGRDVIFAKLLDYFNTNSSFFNFLFGNGADYTVVIAGNFAHNDWLELLINQGVLGILLYVGYFASLLYSIRKSKNNVVAYSTLIMIFFIMFTSSLFSMSYNSLRLPVAIGLGFCLCKSENNVKVEG